MLESVTATSSQKYLFSKIFINILISRKICRIKEIKTFLHLNLYWGKQINRVSKISVWRIQKPSVVLNYKRRPHTWNHRQNHQTTNGKLWHGEQSRCSWCRRKNSKSSRWRSTIKLCSDDSGFVAIYSCSETLIARSLPRYKKSG